MPGILAAAAAAGVPFATGTDGRLELRGEGFAARSAALRRLADALRREGLLGRERGEHYAVARRFADEPLAQIDRSAVTMFGVRPVGVHLVAWLRRRGELFAWVAMRARDKPTFPGRWDNTVAGGQPIGLSLTDNLVKECAEEACMPRELAAAARRTGEIRYLATDLRDGGLKPDTLVCFDLEVPADFVPRPGDGEVERFELLPARAIVAAVRDTDVVKPNCRLVWLDWFLRHGVLDDELDAPQRERLAAALRPELP